ncbi:MAG: cytochrome-c oxidase, cbb3-type subunit III [Hyphomicrobiaceae bacterium]
MSHDDKHNAPDIDHVTGVETTGHEWDGIKELNKPLPKWWLYVFYATIVWSIGYWVLYPAWPTLNGYTEGVLGHSSRKLVMEAVEENRQAQSVWRDRIKDADLETIRADDDLLRFALASGAAAFGDNCSGCHGRGAQGGIGYPNLNDDDWVWGGTLEAIEHTIRFGIRGAHEETRTGEMPAFGADEILEAQQIRDVANYVLSLSGKSQDQASAGRGQPVYEENCASCHGDDGKGNHELGAPNLTDAIWLYGSDKEVVVDVIHRGRAGMMPAWHDRLDEVTIKSLAVYVHSLGGGQ